MIEKFGHLIKLNPPRRVGEVGSILKIRFNFENHIRHKNECARLGIKAKLSIERMGEISEL